MTRSLRLRWILAVALLALPATARAGQVYGDFDHDGRRDSASLDPAHASILKIWLSSTQTLRVIRTRHPIATLGAFDLDGDGRAELVAADTGANLHVWRASARGQIHRYLPRGSRPRARSATPVNVEDDDDTSDVPLQTTTSGAPPFEASVPAGLDYLAASSSAIAETRVIAVGRSADATSSRGPPR
jgi:hypothetical protein